MGRLIGYYGAAIYYKLVFISPVILAFILINDYFLEQRLTVDSKAHSIQVAEIMDSIEQLNDNLTKGIYATPEEIIANKITIKNRDDKKVFQIEAGENNRYVSQSFFDKDGIRRIGMSISEDNYSGITLFGKNSKPRISIIEDSGVGRDRSYISFINKDGNNGARLINTDGASELQMFDGENQDVSLSLSGNRTDWAGLRYFHKNGNLGAFFGGNSRDNISTTQILDGKKNLRYLTSSSEEYPIRTVIYNSEGQVQEFSGVNTFDESFFVKYAKDQKIIMSLISKRDGQIEKIIHQSDTEKIWDYAGKGKLILDGAGALKNVIFGK